MLHITLKYTFCRVCKQHLEIDKNIKSSHPAPDSCPRTVFACSASDAASRRIDLARRRPGAPVSRRALHSSRDKSVFPLVNYYKAFGGPTNTVVSIFADVKQNKQYEFQRNSRKLLIQCHKFIMNFIDYRYISHRLSRGKSSVSSFVSSFF